MASGPCRVFKQDSAIDHSNVLSGSQRLVQSPQITVPKEGVTVLFCPSGVRAPQRANPMGRDGKPIPVRIHCK